MMEVRRFGPAGQETFLAHVELVLEQDFQELFMAQAVGRRFLQAQAQGSGQAGEPQFLKCRFNVRNAH